MTKFAKMLAVAGCCAGMALVGCQSTRNVDASGAECGKADCCKASSVDVQATEKGACASSCKESSVDVQASECSTKSDCAGKTCPMTGKAIDVQASECSTKSDCSGKTCDKQ